MMVVATIPHLLTVVHASYFVQIFISIGVSVHRNRGASGQGCGIQWQGRRGGWGWRAGALGGLVAIATPPSIKHTIQNQLPSHPGGNTLILQDGQGISPTGHIT